MATYNGWRNRQTWNVALWLGGDYRLYTEAQRLVRGATLAQAVERIKRLCVEVWPDHKTPDGCDLRGVDWRAVARSQMEG